MIRSPRLTVAFSNIGHAYTHLFTLLYATVVLALEREFNLPYGELLTLSLPGFILYGAGALPAGWLGDRWSGKGMLAVFFFGLGASAIFTGLAGSPFEIGLGLAMLGLFASIYHPVGIALIVSNSPHRGRALGLNGVFGILGTAAAALVAGALMDWIGWRAAFIMPGAAAIATGMVFLVFARGGRISEQAPSAERPVAALSRSEAVRTMVVLSITLLCAGLIYQVTTLALPKIIAQRVSDFSVDGGLGVGLLVAAVYLFSILALAAGGYMADRYPLKPVYILSYLAQAPLFVVAAALGGHTLLIAMAMLISLNVGAAPAESCLIAQYAPARWRATAFGAKFAVALGVSALGVPLVAIVYDNTGGFFWLFVILGALAGLLATAALFLPSGRTRRAGIAPAAAPAPSQGD